MLKIFEMSLSASVLILVVIIIRALVLHKLPKKTFLVLWGVALCRLLIPFSIPSRFSVYSIADMLKNKALEIDTPSIVMATPDIVTAAGRINNTLLADMATVTVSPITIIWMIGMLACALFFLVTHFRCRREYKTALPTDNEFVKRWQQEHPISRKVEIRQSDEITAPLTYGIFWPVVLLPKATDWTDETTLRYILAHEFVHIRCVDTRTKLLLASALCIHWFNPFVWVMYVLANRDIELSCDETVIHTFGETIKSTYAMTLIRLEEKKSNLTPLVNNFSKNAIEERIVSIMKVKKKSLVNTILALGLVIGTVTVFATSTMASTPFAEVMLSDNASGAFISNNEAFSIDQPAIISSITTPLIPLEMGTNDRNGTDGAIKEVEIQEVSSEVKTVLSGVEHIERK
ncbi:MAG: M56 family metallopeptidase [Ruminiclostridium sp.]